MRCMDIILTTYVQDLYAENFHGLVMGQGGRRVSVTIKVQHKKDLCNNRTVSYFDCSGVYMSVHI